MPASDYYYWKRQLITMENTDYVLVAIAITIIVGALSFGLYLILKEDPVKQEEDIFKLSNNKDREENLDESDSNPQQETLQKLMNNNNIDISTIKGHTDLYDWTQTEKEVFAYY